MAEASILFLYMFKGKDCLWEVIDDGDEPLCRISEGSYAGTEARFSKDNIEFGRLRYVRSAGAETLC